MTSSVIVAIRSVLQENNSVQRSTDGYVFVKIGGYNIYKIKPKRTFTDSISVKIDNTILMFADVAFDIVTGNFIKNRFGSDFSALPDELHRIYVPSFYMTHLKKSYGELEKDYSKAEILQAIYLTDTYNTYIDHIDHLEYQLVRFKNGKEIPNAIMQEIIEKFPEKLI